MGEHYFCKGCGAVLNEPDNIRPVEGRIPFSCTCGSQSLFSIRGLILDPLTQLVAKITVKRNSEGRIVLEQYD